jgi:sec-independent protein translocase protein TatC
MSKKHNEQVQFLIELRTRLLYSLIFFAILFAPFLYYANHLYTWLAFPLLKYLPEGRLIATQLISPFFVPFKLALMAAMLSAIPFFLYQLWIFIVPALYGHERRVIWPCLFISTSLFYTGIAFAYFCVFPALFHFLTETTPSGVILSPDISDYLDFTIKLLLIFGSLFEIPMIMVLLTAIGIVSRERFSQSRSYAIIGAFIIGMLLAPPDILSQTILAIPIWLLYEIGIVLSRILNKNNS